MRHEKSARPPLQKLRVILSGLVTHIRFRISEESFP